MSEQKWIKMERDLIQMHDALRRITKYQTPAQMQRSSQKDWGLEYAECLEMAYENVIGEAKNGLKGVRLPKPVAPPSTIEKGEE